MSELGFGFLRLPLLDKKDEHSVDHAVLNLMTDLFIEKGGRYFDTAFTYLGGASEEAVRISLAERYPRDSFILADKLPSWLIRNSEDCRKIFEKQLSRCGVDFFDVYMLHWLNEVNYINAENCGGFKFLEELKSEGKILKSGFSFHDSPELLDKILSKHPEIDYVQLQILLISYIYFLISSYSQIFSKAIFKSTFPLIPSTRPSSVYCHTLKSYGKYISLL